jgi:NAD(P)-dependent dehydrogenase (short-subunit alcohol dehydrogenase family)
MGRVEGKVAIVTGAASNPGLGFATATLLAREGAAVVVTDIDGAGARLCADAITAAGGRALAFQHDVSDEARWVAVVAEVMSHLGRIDILVNNAGMFASAPLLESLSLADWNRQVDVNMTSVFLGCKEVIPLMRQAGGGSIVNISSVGGLLGIGTGAYGATKAGVRILSKSIGVAHAKDGIRCNSVHPGLIRTSMSDGYFTATPERAQAVLAEVPMARRGEPDDIAYCVLYLACDESRFVTGTEFVVDGGQSAR